MAKRFPPICLLPMLLCVVASAQNAPLPLPPVPDSIKIGTVSLDAYHDAEKVDTGLFAPGDSIFLYDGGLYFRARANGRNFFVSKDEILKHSDSLVVYQSLRLTPSAQGAALSDTAATVKAQRQRCTAVTRNGARCRRMALPGLDKCWQHKK